MNPGEIWWADLPVPEGSEPGYRRPVLIISSSTFNRSAIRTVLAVVVTSNTRLSKAPGNIFLSTNATGLSKDAVANVSQVVTVDKAFLDKRVGVLSADILAEVKNGLKLVLEL